tara:strand:+ start:2538 stop:3428 length:891 start_codon:yes stop_codon:yes gene_type:complete
MKLEEYHTHKHEIKQQLNADFSKLGPGIGRFLRDYPVEEEFSTRWPGRFFTVPQGYEVVSLWAGGQTLPDGWVDHRKGAGLRFSFGFGGLMQSNYVVNTQLQTQDLESQDVSTNDPLQLDEVDATIDYRVVDPVKAMTKSVDYRLTTFQKAMGRVIGFVGSKSLDDLLKIDLQGRTQNLMRYEKDNPEHGIKKGDKVILESLEKIGVEIEGLYFTKIKLPAELEKALAKSRLALAEAEGRKHTANVEVYVAERLAQAAELMSPKAFEILKYQVLRDIAKSGSATFFQAPDINVRAV